MKATITTKILPAFIFLLVAHALSFAAVEEFPGGAIVEKVVSKTDAGQSYALYLPSNYTASKKWPVIYGFDPAARGNLPVQLFKDAAEKYGYIVVGSNNSRNGPAVPLQKIIATLWDDTHARFSIDERRVYATGFSGGARVACAFASAYEGMVAGVIACGAGFPSQITPSRSTPFVFFGTVGTDDFNYFEMRQLDRTLDSLGIAHRVEVFEGGHDWASPNLLARAVEWLEIQANKKRATGERNDALLDETFKREVARAKSLEAARDISNAFVGYKTLAADFKGLREVSEYERKAAELGESKEVKEAFKKEREQEQRQRELSVEIYKIIEGMDDPANRAQAFNDLKRAVSGLRKRADEPQDSGERRVARRVRHDVYARTIQEALEFFHRKNYDEAALRLEISTELMPDDASLYLSLARTYARQGKKKKALDALKKSVETGLADPSVIEQNQDFQSLRDEAEFKIIVENLKKK